jgi:hypothetical protein
VVHPADGLEQADGSAQPGPPQQQQQQEDISNPWQQLRDEPQASTGDGYTYMEGFVAEDVLVS